ncbi:manganese-dependent ADP-ribose/CDP-alcohol diphosphatase isoform X2 [Zonotrichia albicollis]|uniref:manganese-dependent ADP-ribose/CDP-alcohol diphosphatase isoform X2 n=1 Tax=Zonotrichia albicollis TaxID=44394 RepID=UPI003D810923
MQAAPRLAFGVIADIQFADAEDGYDFGGCRRRYYRHSLRLLREAVWEWAAESPPINFVLQLGDSIDGQNARRGEAESALQQVLEVLGQLSVPVHHAWGNHELYNFSRARLVHTGLYSRPAGGSDGPADRECHAYHCSLAPRLRLVVLDSYDASTLGVDPGSPRYQESLRVLREKNTNDDLNNPEAHVPIHPCASNGVCLAWNYEAALSVIHRHRCVVCVLAGHLHDGAYCQDLHGVHHLTLEGLIETPPDSNAFATVHVYEDKMVLKGRGRIPDRVMHF